MSDAVEFTLERTLRGHTSSINYLVISPDQSRLISIAEDSTVIVWSIATGKKLFVADRPFSGAATAVSWTSRDSSCFVVGFATGDLHLHLVSNESGKLYRDDSIAVSGGDGSVNCIAYDPIHDRIASISAKSTQLWTIKESQLIPILQSPFVSEGYGTSIQFCDNGTSVAMYYLDSRVCLCYSIDSWKMLWSKRLNTRMYDSPLPPHISIPFSVKENSGFATPSDEGEHLFVSNLRDGIDEYRFPGMQKVQTFAQPIENKNRVIQVRKLPSHNFIVTGGDDGFARVFDRTNGQLVSKIYHGPPGHLVQVIEAFVDSKGRSVVVTASSDAAPFELKMWFYQPAKAPASPKEASGHPAGSAPSAPSSTWRDLIAVAFLTFLLLILFITFILAAVGMFILGLPDISHFRMVDISRRLVDKLDL